jgi:hypothetical protein
VQTPIDATLMGSNIIHGPKAKIQWHSTGTDSGRQLAQSIPDDSERILIWD